jgi:Fanconi anemia group I protein
MDVEDVAPLVYQLLLLSRKGHKLKLLQAIVWATSSIAQDNSAQRKAHYRSQGIIALYIVFHLKQDQELGVKLLKWIKDTRSTHFDSFILALMLCLGQIHRLEEAVVDTSRHVFLAMVVDNERITQSYWLYGTHGRCC